MTEDVLIDDKAVVKVLAHPARINGVPVCYDIVYDEGFSQAVTLDFAFRDVPGVTDESLLSIVRHRLSNLPRQKEALFYVEKAIESLRRARS